MAELKVSLHEAQMEIFRSPKRFKVASCGRRFGKSYLAAWVLIIKALQSPSKDVFYVAPTFQQAKDILWAILKDVGRDVIKSAHENTATLTLINDRKIYLKGSDRPDTLRGVGLAYVVMDEYASMKPEVWEMILRPTLADVKGGALFIGTPAGKNHFYKLWVDAQINENQNDWEAFQFNSTDNTFLDPSEINDAKRSMSTQAFRQEFEATFESFSGGVFKEEWIKYSDDDVFDKSSKTQGSYVISVDPAGFEKADKDRGLKSSKLDETAISVVKICGDEWHVKDILHGRWGIKETAEKILDAAEEVETITVGIEAGALKNAIMPYIEDLMRIRGRWVNITDVSHGGKKKQDRIVWALQGRMEHGKLMFRKADWNHDFITQMLDFPSPLSHDDLLDSLAYIDQVSVVDFAQSIELEDWDPIDEYTGY
jgi:predicted phage terminase large subunit-like protein|tara:strand:- start:99 stop:1376 length:1278 start_codon:yes stop_codon:yes gene_type:complete